MLCQFSVRNFKSIRDTIILNMQAASISEHMDQVIYDQDEEVFLPVSVIYGPNGGGKSNVLEAILAMVAKVRLPVFAAGPNSSQEMSRQMAISVKPFAFSNETKESATEFEVFFRTKLAEYRYVLHVMKDRVIYESLDRIKMDTGRKSALFERNADQILLKGELAKLKKSEDVSEQLPLLSYLAIMYSNNEVIRDVFNWFAYQVEFLNYASPFQEQQIEVIMQKEMKELFLMMLEEMDIPIIDFRTVEEDNEIAEIFTKHSGEHYDEELTFREESNGTRKLFHLLPHIIKSLLQGGTLIVDELDARLHPLLIKHIIRMYTNLSINKHGAQLVFTSHDLSTMNSDMFRRDEIWFVAKGTEENSLLYSLVEFKDEKGTSVRKDAKFDKQYLEGKYGADPYLKKIIDWSVSNA